MLLLIIQIVVFASWSCFIIYSWLKAKKRIKVLADNIALTVPFECKKCHTIREYSFDEYNKIIRKVRNETTIKILGSIKRTKEYKYPCEVCGSKQWQKLLKIQPFSGTSREKEYFRIIIFFIIKVFAYSIFVFLFFCISEAFV